MIERHYSLSKAARAIGVTRQTLKCWLAADLAMVMPAVRRGSKLMIAERQLEQVIRKRRPQSNWALIRKAS